MYILQLYYAIAFVCFMTFWRVFLCENANFHCGIPCLFPLSLSLSCLFDFHICLPHVSHLNCHLSLTHSGGKARWQLYCQVQAASVLYIGKINLNTTSISVASASVPAPACAPASAATALVCFLSVFLFFALLSLPICTCI